MVVRGIFAAFVALVISATLVGTADAYPLTARSGTTTVTGTYRPLVLDLNLVESYTPPNSEVGYNSSIYYENVEGAYLDLRAVFTGTYKTTGYPSEITGNAGYWFYHLVVGDNPENYVDGFTITEEGNSIVVSANGGRGQLFGTLEYLGGGAFTLAAGATGNVPDVDTPQTNDCTTRCNDYFKYFTTAAGPALSIILSNFVEEEGEGGYSDFLLSFQQGIQHLGPFGSPLELGRTSLECFPDKVLNAQGEVVSLGDPDQCGSATLTASSSAVPEPASLALVGLGLVALGLGRRRQQRLLRV